MRLRLGFACQGGELVSNSSQLFQVVQKPAVLIASVGDVSTEMVNALQEGLEEEGIPCELQYLGDNQEKGQGIDQMKTAIQIVRELAGISRVNVGLVVSGDENIALLHHRDLSVEKPLMRLSGPEITVSSLQILGRNAARLVKGDPFILA